MRLAGRGRACCAPCPGAATCLTPRSGRRIRRRRRPLPSCPAATPFRSTLDPPWRRSQPPAPGTARQPNAERRQLTLLSCGLAGSTALAARLDPEDLRAVVRAYHRAAGAAVEAQGGAVAQLLGDGVLACFGWPRAHEDDAERAVRAGLAVAEAVAGLRMPQAGPLAARVGVATGPVVVGEVLGEDGARERGVLGRTPGLAARLRDAAGPGAVAADAATRRLTGGLFEWADLGELAARGLPRAGARLAGAGPQRGGEPLRGAARR